MKTLKHLGAEKADTVVEVPNWPSGKSLWDRYTKCRRLLRSVISPILPSGLQETPSGKGLILAFQKVAFTLYKDVRSNQSIKKLSKEAFDALDNPHDAILQNEIDKKITSPFHLLLTARIFFDSPTIQPDIKQVQDPKKIPSRAALRKEANMKRVESSKAQQEKLEKEAAIDKRRRLNNERNTMKTSVSKANSMAEIARNETIKSYFNIYCRSVNQQFFRLFSTVLMTCKSKICTCGKNQMVAILEGNRNPACGDFRRILDFP